MVDFGLHYRGMRFIIFILSAVLLAGCSPSTPNLNASKDKFSLELLKAESPKIPFQVKEIPPNVDELIAQIDQQIDEDSISKQDIERGWYPAVGNAKKLGTPKSWKRVTYLNQDYWVSLRSENLLYKTVEASICEASGGQYQFSCIETELAECEYIPESNCLCSDETKWSKEQGCLLIDETGDWISITLDELSKGWYLGKKNEKKKGTPQHWRWIDWGDDARWSAN